MSRINTNVQSLIAQRVLGQNNNSLNTSLTRLSTGLRVNRGKDDPAGLIASENLRSELAASNAAIKNTERADQVVSIADGALTEISGLLTELQGLVTSTANGAGLSESEREASQLQINSILETIDRISQSTNFQGTKLINGNFGFQTEGVSGVVEDFTIRGAKFETASLGVDVVVTQSAQQGQLYLNIGGASLDLGGQTSAFVVEISGSLGSRELSFSSGVTAAQIATTINSLTDVTGLTASASASGITLKSVEYGSAEYTSVKVIDDGGLQAVSSNVGIFTFESDDATTVNTSSGVDYDSTAASQGIRDLGQNVGATINGLVATTKGRTVSVNSDFLDVKLTLSASAGSGANAITAGAISAFDITGGGADFQLASQVNIAGKVSIGIDDVAVRKIGQYVDPGDAAEYYLDDLGSGKGLNVVDGDLSLAQKVISSAIEEVSTLRGRLGAFQKNTIGATIRSLNVAVENTAAAESAIRDTDFASETAGLTRSQILVQSSATILSLANQQPQTALQLLG
ncbi:MAG: flagellin [Phycisphaerales bacterium]|nr:flagellin [Phycisphaerales bacterium]MCB9840452.1 flagellin [Phycisphaeraceae bacterium]